MEHEDLAITANLRTNNGMEAIVHIGDPLWLSITLYNDRAMHVASAKTKLDSLTKELENSLQAGRIDQENYRKEMAEVNSEREGLRTSSIKIGREESPWQKLIAFYLKTNETWVVLSWHLRAYFSTPDRSVATLDEENCATAEFGLDPSEVERLPKGDYVVKAVIEILGEGSQPPVRIETNNVMIQLTGAKEEMKEDRLQIVAWYFLKRGMSDVVAKHARKLIELNPKSITGYFFLGEAEKVKGNLKGALKAYTKAEQEFRIQYPNSYELPAAIIKRIIETRAKLGLVSKPQDN